MRVKLSVQGIAIVRALGSTYVLALLVSTPTRKAVACGISAIRILFVLPSTGSTSNFTVGSSTKPYQQRRLSLPE